MLRLFLLPLLILLGLTPCSGRAADDGDGIVITREKTQIIAGQTSELQGLEQASATLGQLIPLQLKDGQLKLDREAWIRKPENAATPEQERDALRVKVIKRLGLRANQLPPDALDQLAKSMFRLQSGNDTPGPEMYFARVVEDAGGGGGTESQTQFNDSKKLNSDTEKLSASMELDEKNISVRFSEKADLHRTLQIEIRPDTGLKIQLNQPDVLPELLLLQQPDGKVVLNVTKMGGEKIEKGAASFQELVKLAPDVVQLQLLKPLAKLGIQPGLNPWLPTVMAAACSGYAPPAPANVAKLEAAIKNLGDDEREVRAAAQKELIMLYPQAVQAIRKLQAESPDPEIKLRLEKVLLAHPGIEKALPYVEREKLHENKAYLLDILKNCAFFHAAARMRLNVLYGKDYGDDAAAWPAP